ncbi:hypothetical protein DSM107007_58410 [Nostoc sp. PCC 7120 = FACHB-418]|nr:hypothetical protein DSM107007_58410 [Nostoc sp. PCC 7120 = FACHB-418]
MLEALLFLEATFTDVGKEFFGVAEAVGMEIEGDVGVGLKIGIFIRSSLDKNLLNISKFSA